MSLQQARTKKNICTTVVELYLAYFFLAPSHSIHLHSYSICERKVSNAGIRNYEKSTSTKRQNCIQIVSITQLTQSKRPLFPMPSNILNHLSRWLHNELRRIMNVNILAFVCTSINISINESMKFQQIETAACVHACCKSQFRERKCSSYFGIYTKYNLTYLYCN
jgi:hypothetical protein